MRRTAGTRYLLMSSALLLPPTAALGQVSVGATGGIAISDVTGDDVDDDATDSRGPAEGDVKNRSWFARAGVGWVVGG